MTKAILCLSLILTSFILPVTVSERCYKKTLRPKNMSMSEYYCKDEQEFSPPWNFSWIIENELAGMAQPKTKSNLEYLVKMGIKHLVTLSPEMLPPPLINDLSESLRWTTIDIEEFEPPTLDQIKEFIEICRESRENHRAVGVHCRMGRGRTGVMAACYLVHFYNMAPEKAIIKIRLQRPGSVETREQERAIWQYHDYIRRTLPEK